MGRPHKGKPLAIEGDLSAHGMRFAIVVARWNAVITDRLLQGALDGLLRSGAARRRLSCARARSMGDSIGGAKRSRPAQRFDGVIILGVLLRGETAHYEAIYNEVAAVSASRSRRPVCLTALVC